MGRRIGSFVPLSGAVPWLVLLVGCSVVEPEGEGRPLGTVVSALTAAEQRARATEIRDIAAESGLPTAGLLLAGIANAETGLAHCWSEATWACQGPTSSYCGGPVIAGAGDGPCSARQGGLGMFQFDAGTYDDTLAREGDRILDLRGNIEAAIDFVANMVVRSTYIDGVSSRAEALDWLNGVRPDNERFDPWIRTVVRYYNGCVPGRCSLFDSRYDRYRQKTLDMLDLMGWEFWYGARPAVSCPEVPAAGGVVDDADPCFEKFGPSRYWRRVDGIGEGSWLWWTNAWQSETPSNWARWRFRVAAAGRYRVEVSTVAAYSKWNAVRYRVADATGEHDLEVDLAGADGWQPLGEYSFMPGTDWSVAVFDHAGVSVPADMHITVDAIRLVPRSVVPPMDGGTPPTPDGGAGGLPEGGAGFDPDPDGGTAVPDADVVVAADPVDRGSFGGGCSCRLDQPGARGGASAATVWLLALLLGLLQRRRKRPAVRR